jgi:RimJ/RimL family protein N-acetyltransferase
MAWTLTGEVDEFLAAARTFLDSDPVRHTVLLTVTDRLRRGGPTTFGPPPLLGWWTDGGGPTGVFLLTPPYPLNVTRLPDPAIPALVDRLAEAVPALDGIGADQDTAERFASGWQARTGAEVRVHRRMRLYRLGRLVPAEPSPPGRARPADEGDRALLREWYDAFRRELREPARMVESEIEDRLGYRGFMLWEVDGSPVSLAGRSRAVCGVARVGPVYTPVEWRGRGYGGAVTAAVSRSALDAGATDVVLFTDLANPMSNAIYQRLGYRPVQDRLVLSFHATGAGEAG